MSVHLRSGTSLWQALETPSTAMAELTQDATCEVAIVGAGITGTLVAHYLLEEGVDTLLLDIQAPGAASTTASTGLLQYEADVPLCDLIDKVGLAAAVQSYQLGVRAIDDIESLAARLTAECAFSRRSSLYLASSPADLKDVQKEFECRSSHGFDVSLLTQGELADMASFSAPGAIQSRGDAQINPLRFTRELATHAQARGLRCHRGQVTDVVPTNHGVVLATSSARVTAKRVVIATGYAAHGMLKQDLGSLHSTYAVASAPLASFDGWPEQCLLWETARPYCYLRASADGRAIAGGEDTPYSTDHQRDELLAAQTARLRQRFEQMFPHTAFIPEFAWAGTFSTTKDGLAYIGESPELPHAYFALGYGGNGITFGVIAARVIADLFVRRPNPDAHIFRFDR